MTDTATKCNATFDAAMRPEQPLEPRLYACALRPGHEDKHMSDEAVVWTDDLVGAKSHQVRHRLDATDPEYLLQLLDQAWGVIANAGEWPGTSEPSPGWLSAAERWRDEWHEVLDDSRSVTA